MIDIHDRVRESLAEHAADAPAGDGLLAAVHARARRNAVRRRLVVGTVVTVVLVAAIVPAAMRNAWRDGTAVEVATPAPPAPRRGAIQFVAGELPRLSVPVSPGWLPQEVHARADNAMVEQGSGRYLLVYNLDQRGPSGRVAGVFIAVDSVQPAWWDHGGAEMNSILLDGKPAKLRNDSMGGMSLAWLDGPGRWLTVGGYGAVATRAVLEHIARELQPDPTVVDPGIRLALLPKGYTVRALTESRITLSPAGAELSGSLVKLRSFTVGFVQEGSAVRRGESVRVSGRQGWLAEDPHGMFVLHLRTVDGRVLQVQAPGGAELTRAEFLAFAQGITVRPGARGDAN